jgi:hypothetical protein
MPGVNAPWAGSGGFAAPGAGRSLDYLMGYVTGASHVLAALPQAPSYDPAYPVAPFQARSGFGGEGFPQPSDFDP